MKMVIDVKEVFSNALEAETWVNKTFKTHLEREKAMLIIIENKKTLGIYCYG